MYFYDSYDFSFFEIMISENKKKSSTKRPNKYV